VPPPDRGSRKSGNCGEQWAVKDLLVEGPHLDLQWLPPGEKFLWRLGQPGAPCNNAQRIDVARHEVRSAQCDKLNAVLQYAQGPVGLRKGLGLGASDITTIG
jgi:hypothetical protein